MKMSNFSIGMSTQQSHHCGIETVQHVRQGSNLLQQQSHHCGIETYEREKRKQLELGSNRTIVGLKPSPAGRVWVTCDRSNRTIVGLKRNHLQVGVS